MKAQAKLNRRGRGAPADTVTILWTSANKLATKQFIKSSNSAAPSVKPYEAGYLYTTLEPIGVNNIEELSEVLKFTEKNPRSLIIRGALVDRANLGKPIARTGSGEGVNFVGNFKTPESGRCYLEIDVDKYPLPTGLKLKKGNVEEICEHIVRQLPEAFHETSYHWQLSSSAGVFDNTKLSAHFWFWLKKPLTDAALKRWAKYVNNVSGVALVDASLYQHVQPHYTATPIFKGMVDPFPTRSGLKVKSLKWVDLKLPPPDVKSRSASTSANSTLNSRDRSGFAYFLNQIGDHTGGDGFHRPIVQAAASYVAEHGSKNLDTQYLYNVIRDRILAADCSKHSESEVADRASKEHIQPAIASALQKFGGNSALLRKSRRIKGIPPHFQGEFLAASVIHESLNVILDEVF